MTPEEIRAKVQEAAMNGFSEFTMSVHEGFCPLCHTELTIVSQTRPSETDEPGAYVDAICRPCSVSFYTERLGADAGFDWATSAYVIEARPARRDRFAWKPGDIELVEQ